MANNKLAYGLARKHNIDTKGKSPKQVWDLLKEKGITPESAAKERDNKLSSAENIYNNDSKSKKLTPAEKIASVKIQEGKDNILPELNEIDLQKVGASQSKPVLVKKTIIDRNARVHPDIKKDEIDKIIGEGLYNPAKVFKGNKEGYHKFAQIVSFSTKTGEPQYGTVLLDINETLENFEVVHWHFMRPSSLERAEKKNK